jgi:hypothetical protein
MEQLAAFSLLARWIERANVMRMDDMAQNTPSP